MDTIPKVINNQLYFHVSQLTHWEKNAQVRSISKENWEKLKASLIRNGVKDPFKISPDGVVYDGNNRLKAVNEIIKEGITEAGNGKEMEWIPVQIENPKTEAEKWEIAFRGNGHYAQFNDDGLANFLPEFESDIDIALYNVDFKTPHSLEEQLKDLEKNIKPPELEEEKAEVECPNCHHKFTP